MKCASHDRDFVEHNGKKMFFSWYDVQPKAEHSQPHWKKEAEANTKQSHEI